MIYVSNKLRYLFDYVPCLVNRGGKFSKLLYESYHPEEVKGLSKEDWDVIHKDGKPENCTSANLELVIFKD